MAEPLPDVRMQRAQRLAHRDGLLALLTALGYLVLFQVSRVLPFGQTSVLLTTLIALVLVFLFTVRVARALTTRRALAINLALSALLVSPLILLPLLAARFPTLPLSWLGPPIKFYILVLRRIPGLHGLLLIWLAASVGVWLSRLVREIKILLPIAVVLALVDMATVFGTAGVVHQATTGQSPIARVAMQALTVTLPQPRTGGAAPLQLSVGFADFLFIALFFACFRRFGVPSRTTFSVLCGVLAAYMGLVYLFGWALPALVPIAVVVVGLNLRQFRYERSEAFAMLYAGLLVTVIGIVFWAMGHRH